MAQSLRAASVQGAAIRVSRLNSNGTTATGASAAYTVNSFIRVSFTPEYEEGEEITERNAAGEVCVTYKSPDTLKRVNLELAICEPDPEFTELVSGGSLLTSAGDSVGWAAPLTGVDANPNGTALQVWSYAVANGTRASTNPYFQWIFPFVQLRPTGERVIENGLLANTFEGYGVGNANFGDGPLGDWPHQAVANRAYAYARVAAAPIGINGYQTGI
jgi:hypothetical protein